ncbi:MAG TPA: proton-conducting transporter membrane subunit, partial [Parasegetibacter sp.]
MIPVLLILIPLLGGLATFFIKNAQVSRNWAMLCSILTLAVSLAGIFVYNQPECLKFDAPWIQLLGSRFTIALDGMGQMLCLLTALAFPLIFLATWKNNYNSAGRFFGLMLLAQAGLLGVFLAMDALLFYFFWELALIPAYFLCSTWGGEKRIAATFKFFIYTFLGSLFMLITLIYLYFQTPDASFSIASFHDLNLTISQQNWVFWALFIAFAIKMPIFPFHSWQPDTYEQSPTAVT